MRSFNSALSVVLVLLSINVSGQEIKITLGYGSAEFLHVGGNIALYQKSEILLTGGHSFEFWNSSSVFSLTMGHRWYLNKKRESNQNKWFFGQKLSYLHQRRDTYNRNVWFSALCFGRNHFLTRSFGFSWDAGVIYVIREKKVDTNTDLGIFEFYEPLFKLQPNLRFGVFLTLSDSL